MNSRKFSMGMGGLAVAGLFLLAAPRAAHAVVAALVQVVNTTANPAITQDTSHQASQILNLVCRSQSTYPSSAACIQIDAHGLYSPVQPYVIPPASNFVLTSLDYYPNGIAPGAGTVSIVDQTNYPTATFEYVGLANVSQPVSFQFGPGIVMAGTTQPAVNCTCGLNPFFFLHGYLTAN